MKRQQSLSLPFHCKNFASILLILIIRYFYDIFDNNSKRYIHNILIASTISLIPLMQSQAEALLSISLSVLQIVIFRQRAAKVSIAHLIQICAIITYFYLKNLLSIKDFLPMLIISVSSGLVIFINAAKLYSTEILTINKN